MTSVCGVYGSYINSQLQVVTLSDEYTTEMLKTYTVASLSAYDDDWNDTNSSYRNLSTDELSYSIRKSRYRFRFRLPKVRTGKCYRVNWVERFIPESGFGINSVEIYSRGVYRPSITFSTPPSNGTQARAVAVMSSTGTVSSIRILHPGKYVPIATLSGGGGTGALVKVTEMGTDGSIQQVEIFGGKNYTSAPIITWSSVTTGQVRATATLSILNGAVDSISFSNRGDYRPRATFATAINGGTTATANVPSFNIFGQITEITVDTAGDYRPTLSFSAPPSPGTTATATCTVDEQGGIDAVSVTASGSGYLSTQNIAIVSKSSGTTAADLLVHYGTETTKCAKWDGQTLADRWVSRLVEDAGHALSSIEVVHGGNYLPTVSFSEAEGSGATATVTGFSSDGKVTAITVNDGGSCYTVAPSVTITGRNGGSGATATGSISAGVVTGVSVTAQGNYLPTISVTPPTPIVVTLSAPPTGGTQATAQANVNSSGQVTSITVTNQGSGYTSAPTVTVLAPGIGGTQATGWTATLTADKVTSITGGTTGDYAIAATVALNPSGAISSITLTKAGAGFKTQPEVRLSYYGTETILLAAHFGTETEYADGTEPPNALPVGYVDGIVRTYPLLGSTGTDPWKYYEIPVPTSDGTTLVAEVRAVCDCSSCS